MKKIVSQIMISLDGFIEGTNGELDWHRVDDEYHKYAEEMLYSVDAILYGRKTFQHMKDFWPTDFARETFPTIAERMNHLPKIVVSKTLESADWNDTTIIKGNVKDQVLQVKKRPGKDLIILGSSELVSALTNMGLIDEFHIIVNPVVLGGGKPYLNHIEERIRLNLLRTRTFRSGNILLCYGPSSN